MRYNYSYTFNIFSPMMHFTLEEFSPSETTLSLIRHIAHNYRVLRTNSGVISKCLN